MRIITAPFPATRHNPCSCRKWLRKTTEDIEIEIADHVTIFIPKGYVTDFASVPRIFWSVISPWGRDELAFVAHDFLYANANKYNISRAFCDRVMYDLQGMLQSSRWRSEVMYICLRLLGFYRFYCLNKRFK